MRGDGEEEMIVPGNNRAVQRRRAARPRLFGKKAKEAFLESFSCTANVAASPGASPDRADAMVWAVSELAWPPPVQAAPRIRTL